MMLKEKKGRGCALNLQLLHSSSFLDALCQAVCSRNLMIYKASLPDTSLIPQSIRSLNGLCYGNEYGNPVLQGSTVLYKSYAPEDSLIP